ncbi:MAG: hypothetical protein ACK4S4_03875 [Pyrinomonadaceae bacterium]
MTAKTISIAAILLILAASVRVFGETSEREQPSRFAVTLLTLFRDSDEVFVATFDKVDDETLVAVETNFTVARVTSRFTVISTLKGEPRKLLDLQDETFRYRLSPEAPETTFIKDQHSFDPSAAARPGDKVLLFLRRDPKDGSLSLLDSRDGIKRLAADDEADFLDRITELGKILAGPKVEASIVAEWLVRCVERPATRWEGAFELERGFRLLEQQERQAKAIEAAAAPRAAESTELKTSNIDMAAVASALSEKQKERLTNALLTADGFDPASTGKLSLGDLQLIKLVRRWGGRDIALSVVQRLKYRSAIGADDIYLMTVVAELIGDRAALEQARTIARLTSERNADPAASTSADPRHSILVSFVGRIERAVTLKPGENAK